MSEKLNSHEKHEIKVEGESSSEHLKNIEKKLNHEAHEAEEKHSGEKIKAKQELEQAISGAEKAPVGAERVAKKSESVSRGVKKQQYQATMRRVEAKLPTYQKAFSKFIHNPTVDKVSNVASKTVARPSGLLGGSVAAAFGLLVLYINARQIGFEYPSGAAFMVLVSFGWLIGIIIEYLYGAFKRILETR